MTDKQAAKILRDRCHLGLDDWEPCFRSGRFFVDSDAALLAAKEYAANPPSPQDSIPVRRRRRP